MRITAIAVVIAVLCAIGLAANAEPAAGMRVIVNAKSAETKLDKRFIADAFLKKRTHWDDDHEIQPVDQGQSSGVRDKFSHEILGRDIASVRRYWAQLVFSGRGVPPPELANDGEVVKYVASHAGAIGYVSATADLGGCKVVEVE